MDTVGRNTYTSVQKVKTFTTPSNNRDFVFSQLSKNVENACIKLRRYNLAASQGAFFLKLQTFRYIGLELKFSRATAIPSEIIKVIEKHFNEVYEQNCLYRATGIALFNLKEDKIKQLDLFNEALRALEMKKIYQSVDKINEKFGKHTVFLGTSFLTHHQPQHQKERNDLPERKNLLFKGENKRQRIGIPMFMGKVN